MTDDLRAPERIWATGRFDLHRYSSGSWNAARLSNDRVDLGEVEYVRADLCAALEAQLADMTRQRDRQYDMNTHLIVKLTKAEAERDAAMAGVVKVKPLVWEHDIVTYYDRSSGTEKPSSELWSADTILATGRYSIMRLVDDRIKRDTETHTIAIRGKELRLTTLEAAKAAAQADYEARIMSALPPDPDRLQALTAAAYEAAAVKAADRCAACGVREIAGLVKEHVVRLTPADAVAALDRITRQARADAIRRVADWYDTEGWRLDEEDVPAAIRAMAEKDPAQLDYAMSGITEWKFDEGQSK